MCYNTTGSNGFSEFRRFLQKFFLICWISVDWLKATFLSPFFPPLKINNEDLNQLQSGAELPLVLKSPASSKHEEGMLMRINEEKKGCNDCLPENYENLLNERRVTYNIRDFFPPKKTLKKQLGLFVFFLFFIINNHFNGTPGKLCAHVEIFPS